MFIIPWNDVRSKRKISLAFLNLAFARIFLAVGLECEVSSREVPMTSPEIVTILTF